MTVRIALAASALSVMAALPGLAVAQGTVELVRVHSPALEGNLEGNDATRDVIVYLPPDYNEETQRRYPVVYFLHGYTATAASYQSFLALPESVDRAIDAGAQEMILVLPDAYTKYGGSMYSNSPTIGDWEAFVARDLVDYVDANYRTIAAREGRGLAGHSMGGYGTLRIGMKYPERFVALYAMSSCCLMFEAPPQEQVEAVIEATGGAPSPEGGFANAIMAQAVAWAPNPSKPPHYYDLPYEDGEAKPLVQAKWIANAPLLWVDQYVPTLESFAAIAIDVGDADPLGADNVELDAALERLGVEHTFELYEGDHVNRVAARFESELLPMFSEVFSNSGRDQ